MKKDAKIMVFLPGRADIQKVAVALDDVMPLIGDEDK